jgi:predicted GNAT family acetyltransferase
VTDVVVSRNEDQNRWEARVDGTLAGFAEYRETEALVIFTHTEVDPAFEGRGVGTALARHALDEVFDEGTHRVMPVCPFIKGWIGRHPEYQHLLHGTPPAPRTG